MRPLRAVGTLASLAGTLALAVNAADGGASALSPYGRLASRRWAHGAAYRRANLPPVANPHPAPEPQPRRDHPFDVAVSGDGAKVYVGLAGSELEPGHELAVYDVARGAVTRRVSLKPAAEPGDPASSPYRLTMHPDGIHLVVTSRFSNFLSIVDTRTDEVTGEVPLDFYAQGLAFDRTGRTAYVTDRYLDQVLVVSFSAASAALRGRLKARPGLDAAAFERDGVHAALARRCGSCHADGAGGLRVTGNPTTTYRSVLAHVVPGDPGESRLLRAVLAAARGGYADREPLAASHARGTVVFPEPRRDPDYRTVARWIAAAKDGPGIPVGNPRSKPKVCVLSSDGRYLYVGNTGTQDISIVDTAAQAEVGAIYVQNLVNDIAIHPDPSTGRDWLLATTMGAGFGTAAERDPYGGESWERDNPAAQYTLWRDPRTGRARPREEQEVLGPFQAVDGTAGIKFRDIQNDLLLVDLAALRIPAAPPRGGLEHLLLANRYEAHRGWVRYTSDTAESTYGDLKGDLPPDLMRVVGSLPEKMALVGDRLFVTMAGSRLVQEWRLVPRAREASDRLRPVAVHRAGLMPVGIAPGRPGTPSAGLLFVANFLGGTLSVIDPDRGTSREVVVDPSVMRRPVPDTNAERGEIFAHTSEFSSDGDTSCVHCHYLDTGDGRPWGVSQVLGQEFRSADQPTGHAAIGGTMGVPQMRALFAVQPFFYEGVISAFEPRSMIMEHAPADDFNRPLPEAGDSTWIRAHAPLAGVRDLQSGMDASGRLSADLEARRDETFGRIAMALYGKAFRLRDVQRFVGDWQVAEPRLLPNPYDGDSASVGRGRRLFEDPQVGCASCHPPPSFARKDLTDAPEQAIPPVVTFSVRDGSFTLIGMNRLDRLNGVERDLEPWDGGRAEATEGNLTVTQLRGIWDRPPVFLHNGLARTLREVLATPGHRGLRRYRYMPLLGGVPERPGRREVGFNETVWYAERSRMARRHFESGARMGYDTHGGTSHLSSRDLDDLANFVLAIE